MLILFSEFPYVLDINIKVQPFSGVYGGIKSLLQLSIGQFKIVQDGIWFSIATWDNWTTMLAL